MNKKQKDFIEAFYTSRALTNTKVNLSLGDLKYFASEYIAIDPTPDQELYYIEYTNNNGFPNRSVYTLKDKTLDEVSKVLIEIAKELIGYGDLNKFESGHFVRSLGNELWTVTPA